jgi:hypothetical protein
MSILLEKEYDKKIFDMDLKSKLEQMCRNCIALDISGKGEYKLGGNTLWCVIEILVLKDTVQNFV